ncbi:tRNA (adenosine(37)-N6)-dimethylallyltransferase MiaA [Treponema sp. OMZ 788]|uniref:tRNA (adenosine(37)-N6)-dimethylallyltransferase MiaA n=1 Tax=Treponema sp. OMZ 788 TaxID=2563664 RepID=UPI0020A28320|nr:tRNA (adenosine(37)-N6)-dimethylallyltransferase MiaA [Treponema sp. OMZ 788]UTC65441.1 tRNA (adenosine(37)-N6)-dimethylallyltransferase MiaA [Treponema sp. OMZ 788]
MNFDFLSLSDKYNSAVVLGATATGKTSYAVGLAKELDGEIISVDSRQVYKGLDLGTGKDLDEYGEVPYHLIDICTLEREYNVFDFQNDAYRAFEDIKRRKKLPIFAGGTGLYLDALIREYELIPVPKNEELRESLAGKDLSELQKVFFDYKAQMHNKTDLENMERLMRAIEIAEYKNTHPDAAEILNASRPDIRPLIIGLKYPREILRERIRLRLIQRINDGMIEETERLHKEGFSWERLESLGLEYKFTAQYLQGKIEKKEEYIDSLYRAICQFAKRQETWFRRMEKNGVKISWILK